MMKSKKLASKILLAVLLAAPYGVANASSFEVINNNGTNISGVTTELNDSEYKGISVTNKGVANITSNSDITFTDKVVDLKWTNDKEQVSHSYTSLYSKNSKVNITADTLTFSSLYQPTPDANGLSDFAGVIYYTGWFDGNTETVINANEIYIGSAEKGGDRGFQFKNGENKLTVNADTLIAYVGDGLINAQGDNTGTSEVYFGTAENPINYFEAHTTYGKQDYGVALLQANEGNTVNLYANTAILDGSANEVGGVIGSGSYGTVNVVTGDLTIEGNICGTYGRTGTSYTDKTLLLKITTDTLKMDGDINIGSLTKTSNNKEEGWEEQSHFSRDTKLEITVKDKAELNGDINVYSKDVYSTYADDSVVTLNFENEATLNGKVTVEGELGVVNLGGNADMTSSTGYYSATNGGTVNFTGGTWAVNTWDGEDGNMSVGNGATVNVNDEITAASVTLASGSTTVIDSEKITGTAITATTTNVDKAAAIKVLNIDTGNTIKLFSDDNTNKNVIANNQVSTNNLMQSVVLDENQNLVIEVAEVSEVLPDIALGNIATALTANNISNAFFDEMLKFGDAAKATAAINSIANMGELAGVNHGTYSMSNTMTDAVAHHLSLATHGEQDKDIWAHYIHNKEDVDGMTLGGVDANYDAQFNGIVIGSDLYKNGKTTAGIALSYADGNINGYNGIARSKNDAEYYGATLYGRIENDNSAVLGDITYMHSDNDVTQTNSGHEITASADADAFSIGVRAEQAIKAGAGKFVPYAGLRYMHLGAGNYTNSLGMEYNADDQNLWLLPVGVTYSAEIASGDWTLKPIAEVGYVWTMGDRETDQTVYLNGAADSFGFETADSGSFISRFGLEAQNGSMTYGLGYEYQKGDSVKANRWLVNMVYSF